jgi:hypothetical protein
MATRKVKLKGLAYWAKVFEDNRDLTGYEDALKDIGGQTSVDVDLDADNLALLRKSRSMKRGSDSPDNDGMTRVKFTRKWTENYGGGAPKVVKADGTDWDYDTDGTIGNGSLVEIILSVYDTSRKAIVGTRREKVKVIEHVVYNPEDDDEDDAPPPAAKAPAKAKPKAPVDLDDEIPFD